MLIDDDEIKEKLKDCSDELALASIEEEAFFNFAFDEYLELISSIKLVGKSEIIRQEMVTFVSTHKQSNLSKEEKLKTLRLKLLRMNTVIVDMS